MQRVDLGVFGVQLFPDDATQEEIQAAVDENFPVPGATFSQRQAPVKAASRAAVEGVAGQAKGAAALSTIPFHEPGMILPSVERESEQRFAAKTPSQKVESIESSPLWKFGQNLQEGAAEAYPLTATERTGATTKVAGGLGSFLPFMAEGPAGIAGIGLQTAGETLDAEYQKGLTEGKPKEEAAQSAINKSFASGALQSALFEVLPKPLRALGDKFIDRFSRGLVTRFLLGRVAQAGEGAALGGASQALDQAVKGELNPEQLADSAFGLAIGQMFFPRGLTGKEEHEREVFLGEPAPGFVPFQPPPEKRNITAPVGTVSDVGVATGRTIIPVGQIPTQPFVPPEPGPLGEIPRYETPKPESEVSNAVQERSTAPVNVGQAPGDSGSVVPREIVQNREERVPAEEQGTAVPQAQAPSPPVAPAPTHTPDQLQPALLVNGKPETGGESHTEIANNLRNSTDDIERKMQVIEAYANDNAHVFVDDKGNVLDRMQAATALGLKDPLQSERLKELKGTKRKEDFEAMVKRHDQEREALASRNMAKVPEDATAIKLQHPDGRTAIVSPDPVVPGKWRLTYFTREGEPWGHGVLDSRNEAIYDGLGIYGSGKYGKYGPSHVGPGYEVVEASKPKTQPLPTPAKSGTVEEPTAGTETTDTVRTATAGEASQTRSTEAGKAAEMTAESGATPGRIPAAGLTPEDDILFPLSQIGKLPMLVLPKKMMADYVRLRNKQRRKELLRGSERDRLREIMERLPDNFEDDYGENGAVMRAAYVAAKKAGIANELFQVVDSARGLKTDVILDRLKVDTGKEFSLIDLYRQIEGLSKAHEDRVSGRTGTKEDIEAKTQVEQKQRFDKDTKKATPGTRPLREEELVERASFTLKGAKVRITRINYDEDGAITSIELDDGKRYGTQTVDGNVQLRIDEGSLKLPKGAGSTDFLTPEVEAAAEPPAPAEPAPVAGVPVGGTEPPKAPAKPAGPAVDLFGNPIEEAKAPEQPAAPAEQQDMLGLSQAAPKKPEVQERPLTPDEQEEFRDLSIKLRANREANGPPLSTQETQRYEHLLALAGQKTLGLGEASGKEAIKGQIKALLAQLAALDEKRPQGRGKRAEQWRENYNRIDREIRKLRTELTEGEGETLFESTPKETPSGYYGTRQFRVRKLSFDEVNERFPITAPEQRMAVIKQYGGLENLWVAESRRINYEDPEGKKLAEKFEWYIDGYGTSAEAAAKEAKTLKRQGWDEVPEKKQPEPAIWSKELWQIPRTELADNRDLLRPKFGVISDTMHRDAVALALREGKDVPKEVLADYPELQKAAPPPIPVTPPKPEIKGPAPVGTTVPYGENNGRYRKMENEHWYRLDENGEPVKMRANGKLAAILEDLATKGPPPEETRTPMEILSQSDSIRVTVKPTNKDDVATFLRAYQANGKFMSASLAAINSGKFTFRGGDYVRLEAFRKDAKGKDVVVPGEISVTDMGKKRQAAAEWVFRKGNEIPWIKTRKPFSNETIYRTPDGLYEISQGFVGNWNGATGEHKEIGWMISKRNSRGEYEQVGTHKKFGDAKKSAQSRAESYGYGSIGFTVEERNAESQGERQGAPRPEGIPVNVAGSGFILTAPGEQRQALPAYHGTPHEVDKFSLSKVGTGEGAQVYGWGLYFAENKTVADTYAKTLSRPDTRAALERQRDEIKEDIARKKSQTPSGMEYELNDAQLRDFRAQLEWVEDQIKKLGRGSNLYTVDLNVKPEQLLDWDKTLGEQPKAVRDAIEAIPWLRGRVNRETSGSELYRILSQSETPLPGTAFKQPPSPQNASHFLNLSGIKGIRYLDQGSRDSYRYHLDVEGLGKDVAKFETEKEANDYANELRAKGKKVTVWGGKETYNYVIFDENVIRITDVNGKRVTMDEARQAMAEQQRSAQQQKTGTEFRKDIEAQSPQQLRETIKDPSLPIPAEMRSKLDRLLQFPIFDKLPGFKVAITDYIAGGMQGEFLPNTTLARIARFAEADVPTHEFTHAIHQFLTPEDRAFVADLRRQFILDEIAKNPDLQVQQFLRGLYEFPLTSDEYFSAGHNEQFYHLTNEFEFFAHIMTEKFERAMAKPEAKTFVAKVRQFMAEFWQHIKDAFGIGHGTYADVLARKLISGDYEVTPRDGARYRDGIERRQASLPLNASDIERRRAYEDIGWRSALVGGYYHLFEVQRRHAENLHISERARALEKMNVHGDLRQIGMDESGKANYYDARDNATSHGERMEVILDAFESVTRYQWHGIKLRERLEKAEAEIRSPQFRAMVERAGERADTAEMMQQVKRTFLNQVAGSAGRLTSMLERQRIIGASHEQLQQALERVRRLPDFSEAVAQVTDHIVQRVAVDDEGISLLGAGGARDGADILNRYFALEPNEIHASPDRHALLQLASAVLAANRDLRNGLTSLAIMARDDAMRQEVNRAGMRWAKEFANNPAKAIPRFAQRAVNLGDKAARAEMIWMALNRNIQKRVDKYNTLSEAVQLHDAVASDPEWKQYVNDVMKDNGGIVISDDTIRKWQQEHKADPSRVPVPLRRAFYNFSGEQVMHSPQGHEYRIDIGWTPDTVQKSQEELGKLSADIAAWLDDPMNADNPSRQFWEERHKLIQSTVMSAGVWNPNAMRGVLGSGSWGMPEVYFQGLALPQAKLTFLAAKNFDRWFNQAKGWFTKNNDPLRTAYRKAYAAHGFGELEGGAFRQALLDQIAFRFRNGQEVRVGDWINGHQVLKEDMDWVRAQGHAFADAFDLVWQTNELAGAEGVMERPRIVDEFQGGAWGIRKAQERGILPHTTLPRSFSDHGRALAQSIHDLVKTRENKERELGQDVTMTPEQREQRRAEIKDEFYAAVSNYLNDPDRFTYYVLGGFISNRTSNIHRKVSPLEDHYRQIREMAARNDPNTPGSVDQVLIWLSQNLDAEWTDQAIKDQFYGEIVAQTERFHKDFGSNPKSLVEIKSDPSRETAFTQATKGEIFPAYFYSYGAINAGELRGYSVDMGMFGYARMMESYAALRQEMERGIADLKSRSTRKEWRAEQLKRGVEKYRNADDFRDLQLAEEKLRQLDDFIAGLPVWAGQRLAQVEGIGPGLGRRLLSDAVQFALTGPRTLWRISGAAAGGSSIKMGQVLWQLGFAKWRSYPAAVLSAVESMFKFGTSTAIGWYTPERGATLGVPLTLLKNIPGAIKAGAKAKRGQRAYEFIRNELRDITDEQYAALSWWNDQKRLGLTPDNPIGDRISNILAEPRTRGGVFDIQQKETPMGKIGQEILKWAAYKPLALGEAGMELVASRFPTGGYNVTYDAVGRMAGWYIDMLATNARKTFETYERLGWLSKFNFQNLSDPKNSLAPWEVLPSFWSKIGVHDQRRIPSWMRPNSTNLQLARELFFSSTDIDLQDLMIQYWKRLSETPREQRRNVSFLAPDEMDVQKAVDKANARARGIISRFVEQTHHATPSNRPYQLQKNWGFMAILPFAGWSAQTIKQFSIFWGKVAYPFGREGAKFDSHVGLMGAAMVSALGFALFSFLGGDSEVRFLRLWDRLVNKKNTQLKTIDEATGPVEAAEIAIHNITAVMPLANSTLNSLLGATGYRGTYGFQAFGFDKINALLNYARGVVRTHDITYGVDRLAEMHIPFSEPLIENLFDREGFQTSRNTVRALQKFGPQDLVERRASASVSLPTELTPYRMRLQEAVFSGRPENVTKAAAEFVEKARELGRPDPEKTLQQTFSTLNPYRQAFGTMITDQQRRETLDAMSPWERDQVEKAERNYAAAAGQLGFTSAFAKEDSGSGGGASGGSGGSSAGAGGGSVSMGRVPGLTTRRVTSSRLGSGLRTGLRAARALGGGVRSYGGRRLRSVVGRLTARTGRVSRSRLARVSRVGTPRRRVRL